MKYALLAFTAFALITPAHAEIVKESRIKKQMGDQHAVITEDLVRKYYDDQIANLKASHEDYLAYVKTAYNDKFVSKQTVTVAVQGNPEQVQQMDKTKADLLAVDQATRDIARTAQVNFNINKININAQNNTARVDGSSSLEIDVARDDGQHVTATTTSDCDDTLSLEQGRLQLVESVCKSRTELKPKK